MIIIRDGIARWNGKHLECSECKTIFQIESWNDASPDEYGQIVTKCPTCKKTLTFDFDDKKGLHEIGPGMLVIIIFGVLACVGAFFL